MAAPILPISPAILPDAIRPAGQSAAAAGVFKDVLASAVESVEGSSRTAATSVEKFLTGEGEELHTAVLATQRAELSFELFMQARNKVVNAYQEIMRMQM